jgi:transcriptional regulator with XRE-family HTH domain
MSYSAYKARSEQARELRKSAGRYLRDLRRRAGLSQLDLANALGLAYYTFVSQVENGAARVPPEALQRWARALGVPTRELAVKLLSYYDPMTHEAIFGKDHHGGGRPRGS